MNKEFIFNIDNEIFNVFSSNTLIDIMNKYHLNNCYELNQIHSDIINIVSDNYQNNTDGDAMITIKKNTPLVIKTADCIPILIYDNKNKILSLVHSGWKGTLNNITEKTIQKILTNFNTNPHNLYVYLYPSIRNCHFEVKSDVYQEFKNKIKNIDKYTIQKDDKYYLDLQKIIIDNLHALGIENIYDANICTYCHHHEFYSYRYNHTDKRNYLVAMIKE